MRGIYVVATTVIAIIVGLSFSTADQVEPMMGLPKKIELSEYKVRTRRQAEPPVLPTGTSQATAGRFLAGAARVSRIFPQYTVEGQHYWPSDYSLTKQIGLEGINELIGRVVSYDRNKALQAAREASCQQRENCIWNQRYASFSNIFGSLTQEQKLMQGIDCDAVFAGCKHYL